MESEQLRYVLLNEKKLRCENYAHLKGAVQNDPNVDSNNLGHATILPLTRVLSAVPLRIHSRYMALHTFVKRAIRGPFYRTCTCNAAGWKEITDELMSDLNAIGRHDLIARVFHLKHFREVIKQLKMIQKYTDLKDPDHQSISKVVQQFQISYREMTLKSGLMEPEGDGRPLLSLQDLESRLVFTRCKRFQNRQVAQQENSYDPTRQRRTLTRPCIVNVESYSNEFKFFDLPEAKSYQILKKKVLRNNLSEERKNSVELLEDKVMQVKHVIGLLFAQFNLFLRKNAHLCTFLAILVRIEICRLVVKFRVLEGAQKSGCTFGP
ncbi:unnamed protein product [Bemisia tabaci]|uniref:Helitron helicase-like domain-containing protein n=1 Tax=Bemisia tabaci TaxID=7038 RepID=A0A9P0A608_BEMTA|nr:unnamed protein product [Bemisia tabaci]